VDDFAALRLQIEWGADEALDEAPVDRLRVVAPAPPGPLSQSVAPPPPIPLPQGEGGVQTPAERALRSATAATTLEQLRSAIAAFDGCALRDTASNLVFAEGNPAASLLVIGDPPGAPEDRSGTPFAGPGGAYLDRMLASVGLQRGNLLLSHLIPWRPPGDRPPSAGELALCLPFLLRLIAIAAPRRLLLLGPLVARSLLPQTASRRRQRGAWIDTTVGMPALPTFSPAELMRTPKDRRAAWADLRLLRRTLDAEESGA